MIKQLGLGCFIFVFSLVLLSKNIRCPPVLPDRGAIHQETTPHMTVNETLENDPVSCTSKSFKFVVSPLDIYIRHQCVLEYCV